MRSLRLVSIGVVLIGLVLPFQPALGKKKQGTTYNAQTSYTFKNTEAASAHGLVIVLSADTEVVTDPSTGAAGPFRNVNGNGTTKITLTNPSSLLDGATEAAAAEEPASAAGETEEAASEEPPAQEAATEEPASAEGASVELVFRTFKKKLSIKNWWWLDEKGKRLGAKQKG